MTTTEENFYVHLGTKLLISYGRQAVVSWFAKGFFFHSSWLNSGFCGMKRLGSGWLIPSPPPFPCPVYISSFPDNLPFGTHLHTWVERGTVSVKCFVQENNSVTPTRYHIVKETFHEDVSLAILGQIELKCMLYTPPFPVNTYG